MTVLKAKHVNVIAANSLNCLHWSRRGTPCGDACQALIYTYIYIIWTLDGMDEGLACSNWSSHGFYPEMGDLHDPPGESRSLMFLV